MSAGIITDKFAFEAGQLPQYLQQVASDSQTGYWAFQLDTTAGMKAWYLAISAGNAIFSGSGQLSVSTFLEILQRFLPRLRKPDQRKAIAAIVEELADRQQVQTLAKQMQEAAIVKSREIDLALKLKLLTDFDAYLFDFNGQAQWIADPNLNQRDPASGFPLSALIAEALRRRETWHKIGGRLKMNAVPQLNAEAIARSDLSENQKQRLEWSVKAGQPLQAIAIATGTDPLEIAKAFAQLSERGLVTLKLPAATPSPPASANVPPIFIVDDSPLVLKQFQNLVAHWGYRVQISQDPKTAITLLRKLKPAIAFIDINMPGVSGFELVKQVRRTPDLRNLHLAILTAESKLSNQYRAKWSGCHFLTKPLAIEDIPKFQLELRQLLQELAPLSTRI